MLRHDRRPAFVVGVCLSSLFLCVATMAAPAKASASSGPQWFTVNQDYSSQRYVELDQIRPDNVGNLEEVCELQLNAAAWFNSGLLMVDGVIYVNTMRSTYAIDATTCTRIWQYDITFTPWFATISNRGSAYLDGKIFRGTTDGRVIALDAKTGKLLWQTQAADPSRAESFTSAPIAWKKKGDQTGKVFIGIITADLGVRGRLMAFDTATGKELWRFNTIPIGIEAGADTWPSEWVGGVTPAGGAFWTSYSLDPMTGELFGPVSNPNPDYVRTLGQNLYTNSVISLNTDSGALNWYCQTIAHDDHDWDLGTQPTLYRSKGGKDMLAIAGKEGFVVGIDRSSKSSGDPMCDRKVVFKTAGTTVPPKLPEPPLNDSLKLVCPGSVGGAQWNGTAYHKDLGILYSGMVDFCFYYSKVYYGADPGFWSGGNDTIRGDFSKQPSGWITAMDGDSGKMLWNYHTDGQVLAGLVPTKGGVLFAGDVRGNLLAFDAKTGKVRKTIKAGGALNHGLISYAVGGRQYVAAAVGGLSLNPAGVSGPLKVVIYSLPAGGHADPVVKVAQPRTSIAPIPLPAVPLPAKTKAELEAVQAFDFICAGCHGFTGAGFTYPPLLRHTELADDSNSYKTLKDFLKGVPPPMPILYPGLLEDKEVEMIGMHLKSLLGTGNPQAANSAPLGYVYKPPTTDGSPQWKAVYSVLTTPRCINCHTVTNYPRQRDVRYPHIDSVVRGTDDKGAPVARCGSCHGAENDAKTGIPGAPDWHLAPISMAWESAPGIAMTGPALCSMIKNRLLNGDRSLQDLVTHVQAPLVKWAWDPGTRWNGEPRTKPPIGYDEFVKALQEWVNAGGDCPAP